MLKRSVPLLFLFLLTSATAVEHEKVGSLKRVRLAESEFDRYRNLKAELDFLAAPVKSASSLELYLADETLRDDPLRLLSEAGRREFLASLTFNEKGLTGFNYRVLERELTLPEMTRVLALFGSQGSVRSFHSAGDGGAECEVVDQEYEVCRAR